MKYTFRSDNHLPTLSKPLMKRFRPFTRRRVILAAVLLAGTLLGYAAWIRLTEPRYQGKSVSYWFDEFSNLWLTNGTFTVNRRGQHLLINNSEIPSLEALVAIGEPAVDYLGRQLSARNPLNGSLYRRAYTTLPISIQNILPNPDKAEIKRVAAAMALVSFGSKAQKQIPAIINLAINKPALWSGTLLVLSYLDVPPLEKDRLLIKVAEQGRSNDARSAIDLLKIRSPLVARVLAEVLARAGSMDNWYFEKLRDLGSDSVVALPSLLSMINSTNAEVRYQIVRTLEAIGPGASNAIPALQACAHDKNSMVQIRDSSRSASESSSAATGTVSSHVKRPGRPRAVTGM
jgi:hypothetical protein